jgi:RNA polymerase sigma factor (sigma-70 family)
VNCRTDQQLLRDYAENRVEAAFAELVRGHVDFVYSAALRMVCDAHLAEDVTQGVFVALAQNARQLADRPGLSGWLHCTARNLAAKTVRSEVRRRAREQGAAAMNDLFSSEPDTLWEHIAPHLDAALGELSEPDRDALLLRYFRRKSAHEMAQALGISEDAAQKRVSRAVERLREYFAKHGVTVGASGLVVAISANAVQAAPVGLAVTISTAAALAGTAIHTSTAVAATKAIAMTTLQKALITATITAAVGTGIYEARQASTLRSQNLLLQQQQGPLVEHIQQLQHQRDDATNRLVSLADEIAQAKSNSTELLKLRSEIGKLRQQTNELGKLQEENRQLRAQSEDGQTDPSVKADWQKFVPKESWILAGRATPEAAMQSYFWAMRQGDTHALQTVLDGMTPGLRLHFEEGLPKEDSPRQEAFANAGSQVTAGMTGFRILEKVGVSVDETLLRVQFQFVEGAKKWSAQNFLFKNIEGQWKLAPLRDEP